MATTPIWTYRGVDTGIDLTGYEVEARDGSIGTVEESTMQAGQSYIVVDTGPWIFGRRVLLPAGVVDRVSTSEEKVFVSRSREEIKNAPEYREPGATETYRQQIGSYYGGLGEPFPASRTTQRQTTSGRRLSSTTRRQTTSRRPTTSRKASKQSSSSRRSTRARSRSQGKTNEGPTRDELYEQAKRLNIDGRSKMNKAQLSRAVGRKRGGSGSTQSRRSSTTTRRKANPVDVQKFLDGVSYPTRKGDLIREAERKRASQKVRSTLKRLPDKRFADPTEVSEAVGKLR